MDPIVAGMCRMESLYEGPLDLVDFALMNEALSARAENQMRAQAAMEKRHV